LPNLEFYSGVHRCCLRFTRYQPTKISLKPVTFRTNLRHNLHQVNVALVDTGVCAMIVDKALWDWPCILPETTIDKACAAAQAAVMLASFSRPNFNV
jgi:hypothetical protein